MVVDKKYGNARNQNLPWREINYMIGMRTYALTKEIQQQREDKQNEKDKL